MMLMSTFYVDNGNGDDSGNGKGLEWLCELDGAVVLIELGYEGVIVLSGTLWSWAYDGKVSAVPVTGLACILG